jgi:hypothetical protein
VPDLQQFWWIPVLAFLLVWFAWNVIRQRPIGARAQAISGLCIARGMVRVSDVRSPFLPQMLPLAGPICTNTFATPDWSLWFYEVGDRKAPGAYAVVVFGVSGLRVPYISVARNGEVDAPLGARGQAVQLESIDFTDRFQIHADDTRAAVMLIDLGMMQWLLDNDPVSFQINGPIVSAMVKTRTSGSAPPDEPSRLFRFFEGFAEHVPPLVRSEFAAPPAEAAAAMTAMRMVSSLTPSSIGSLIAEGRSTATPLPDASVEPTQRPS